MYPYQHKDNEENKLLFNIVWILPNVECVILPESQQYHPVRTTHWDEGEHKVKQTDYFHPITREAVLKTPAHGDNLPTTMIFQSSKQRSTELGLMVTTSGNECHVNRLPEGKYCQARPRTQPSPNPVKPRSQSVPRGLWLTLKFYGPHLGLYMKCHEVNCSTNTEG